MRAQIDALIARWFRLPSQDRFEGVSPRRGASRDRRLAGKARRRARQGR